MELGDQIYKEFLFFNIGDDNFLKVKYIHKLNAKLEDVKDQINDVDVLICTPKKFIQLFSENTEYLNTIQYCVFDEADKYFELGFLDQINEILEFTKENSDIVYGWFSATMHEVVEEILKNFLKDPVKVTIGGRNNVLSSIEQKLVYTGNEYGKIVEIGNLVRAGQMDPPVLIFVQSKERATELYGEMRNIPNIKVAVIHADKSIEERE